MTLPQHLSQSADWGTPLHIINISKRIIGEVELDVASSARHNKRVKAKKYFDKDSLLMPWDAKTVFCNPPGDRTGKLVQAFAQKAQQREFDVMLWVGFSINQLSTLQGHLDFDAICILRKRVCFIAEHDLPMKSPPHHSFVALVCKDRDSVAGREYVSKFAFNLATEGICVYP